MSPDGTVTNGVLHSVYVKIHELIFPWRILSVVKFIVRAETVIYYLYCVNAHILGAVVV